MEQYVVKPILNDGSIDEPNSLTILTTSALKAAAEALACQLTLNGRRPRAIVSMLSGEQIASSVTVYDCEQMPPGTPAST